MSSTVPPITELLDGAQQSAVHLEMRDVYAVPKESSQFQRWLETGERPNDPDSDYWREWTSAVRRTVTRGVIVRRARIVSEPVTDYIRYEHAGTPVNLAAGEQVRWLPRRRASDIALPGNDFWLFDGQLVRFGFFSGDGALVGHTLDEDPATVKLCASAFEAVWERAVPHEQYETH
ncbi:DUF6879 family protein [Streptomyces gibsoniae]|uniref:DUF6879 domain-containing protein n=1 Tax=Streptomyces gibsoniae TaxID=3075529 RepID=A0ABU2U2R9_9ACTN|nr:DUF6879 family protein [Streptomyces sp. DSM 41699]MDT0467525.1 hypothetical protein [Streptomyces sp. DSM 41699]